MAAFPFYPQQDPDDCGVMVLQMLCSYHGLDITASSLRRLINVPYGEISLLGLSKAAESIGFETTPIYTSLEGLGKKVRLPAIVHIQGNHYAILYRWNNKYVWLADPARGKYRLSQADFRALWLIDNRGVVLEINLPAGRSIKLPEGIVNETSPPVFLWTPKLTAASIFHIGLTGVALFLLFQWLGVLFTEIATQKTGIGFPSVLGISFLLLGALYFLERYGLIWADRTARRILLNQKQRILSILPEGPEERLSRIKLEKVIQLRIKVTLLALLKIPVLIGIISYLIWQVWPIAAGLLFLTGGKIVYLVVTAKSWLGDWCLTFAGMANAGTNGDKRHIDQLMTFDTKINTFSVRSLYPDPEVLFLGFFSAASLIMYCWLAKADAATLLVLLIASTFWLLALRAIGGGVRAWQLRYFGIIEKENQNKVEESVLPTRSGNIQYKLPAGFGEWSELIIPSGKATFILGNPGHFRSKILEWLLALDIDDGGLLLVGEMEIGKRERPALWRNVSGIWDDKALGMSFKEQVEHPGGNTFSVEWYDIFNKIAVHHQPEGKQEENQYDLRHSDQKDWQYHLANSLQAEPDIFVLNKSFDDIDPFNRLILLENIVSVRKGKTTIIATAGKESAMVADWIIYIQGNNILDQGISSDVIQRQGLL